MPTLADIYSAIDSARRRGADFVRNPGTSLQQMLGNAEDRARDYNQQMVLAAQGTGAPARGMQPTPEQQAAQQGTMQTMAEAYNPAGTINKGITPFIVKHGSNEVFDQFQKGYGITAKHIYTVPENLTEDAALYGKNIITAEASPKSMIDLTQPDEKSIKAIKKAARDAGLIDRHYTHDQFMEDMQSGNLYQVFGGPTAQNRFLSELFSKYDAVKMPDAKVGGGVSTSIVFENPNLLKIIK